MNSPHVSTNYLALWELIRVQPFIYARINYKSENPQICKVQKTRNIVEAGIRGVVYGRATLTGDAEKDKDRFFRFCSDLNLQWINRGV